MMRFYLHKSKYTIEVSEKPLASPIARRQAKSNGKISSLICVNVEIEDGIGKEVLKMLDETRSRPEILDSQTTFVNSSQFNVESEIKKDILKELPIHLEKTLNELAESGLLVS